ncbi:putative oxidoreductase [Lachnellula hyalina]|uniref:Putative oxidoreductase n=1 Tax=Lachnellula hyalina TaxID=1316788 RepID=A0A8H8U2Q8_9HELO|nr:putative oxidoreductase [Lachnellula hyalina]TVY29242.1 putative oxidoreductase [Lachnellula hyalina]
MTGTTSSGRASLPTADSTKSYWHRDPSKVLFGHRTTPSLPTKADVVIIGSGISGASAAHFLHENDKGKDLDIVMLEAREACWGATGRNGGHCQPLLYSALPEVGAFELRNYQTLEALIKKHNISCDWRAVSGCHACMDADMFAVGLKLIRSLQETSPELAKLVKVITKDSQNPSLSDLRIPSAAGAFLQANAASLWPYKLVSWMLETLLSSNKQEVGNFNLQTNTPVTHLQNIDGKSWIVHTPRGMIATDRVLLTTNAYTSHLLPKFSDLIVPVRGEMSALIPPPSMSPASSTHKPLEHTYVFIGHGKQNINQDDYLVQRPFSAESVKNNRGGELMFGGGRSYAANAGLGVSDDSSIDDPAAAYLRRELNVVLDLQNKDHELEATWEWSGIMGYSRDGYPWVGEVGEYLGGAKGLFVCAGFTGHGMPNTCLSAKAAVDIMLGAEEVDIPECYKISRERVERARALDEVAIADAKGIML